MFWVDCLTSLIPVLAASTFSLQVAASRIPSMKHCLTMSANPTSLPPMVNIATSVSAGMLSI
jgi:hypothetical protein